MRPATDSASPYFHRYIDQVPEDDPFAALRNSSLAMQAYLSGLEEEQGDYRYAEGKWSIKQLLQHLADAEIVFLYRALTFARGDQTELPGFEENEWAAKATADHKRLIDLQGEVQAVRQSTLAILSGLEESAWDRKGLANGSPMSVRAAAFIIAGHERHHLRVLKERYSG